MALRIGTRFVVPLPFATGRQIPANVPPARQFLSQWCWAACIAMVRSTPGVPFKQCEAARLLVNNPDPCDGGGSGCKGGPVLGEANPDCNQVAPQSQIATLWNAALGPTRNIVQQGVITQSALNLALAAGSGHAVQVLWAQNRSLHVALVVGRDGEQYLVHDPCEGELLLTYNELKKVDRVRTWKATWVL